MKRAVCVGLILCMMMSLTALAAAKGSVLAVGNCDEWVSLRADSSTKSTQLAKLPKGAVVTYLGGGLNGFCRVQYGEAKGYVLKKYLNAQSQALRVAFCDSYITLRDRASTGADGIVRIPKGAIVIYLSGADNGFAYVCYNGQYGFALTRYLSAAKLSNGKPRYAVNCEEYISLRSAPSTKAERLAKIPRHAKVASFGHMGNGMEYVCYNGRYGFALTEYLSNEPFDSGGRLKVAKCKEYVTLRAKASTDASSLARIPLGATVKYLGSASNGFVKVQYGKQSGYVLKYYLKA